MKKRLLIVLTLLMVGTYSYSQKYKTEPYPTVQKIENWSFPEVDGYDGTYQFIVKEKKKFIFTDETFQLIENSRLQEEDNQISLSPYLEVIILSSRKVINPEGERFTELFKLN